MKKVLGTVVLLLLVSFGNAFGTQIVLTGPSHGYETMSITLNDDYISGSAGEFSILLDDWETFGYCIELTQLISRNTSYDYDLKNLDYTTGALQAAWLVDEYSGGITSSVESAGLQLAVWKSIYKDNLTVHTTSASYDAYKNYYSTLPAEFTDEMIAELEAKFDVAHNATRQDLLVSNPVPEPGTIVLLGAGLVGLVCCRKKK